MTHTSTERPEALRLADALAERVSLTATGFGFDADLAYAAAELRRLHARVQELEAAPVQLPEPDMFQVRIRPTWDAKHHWTSWEKCTPEAAADYERTPLLHGWAYEVRKLYTEHKVRQLLVAQEQSK